MIKTPAQRVCNVLRILVLILTCVVCLAPFYVALCYAFKSKEEFAKTKLAFPTSLFWGNFQDAFAIDNYFTSVRNSFVVAIVMVVVIVVFCSMGAYIIARKRNTFYSAVFYVFQLSDISALNTLWGLALAQAGVNVGYYVFLYTGFIKSVPVSLEEAATIDGCNRYQTFFYIVFPLLKPITMTVIVLSFLASWNDFIISMIICQRETVRTLPLMQFFFFGEYSSNVSVAFAAALIAMLPAVIVYFCAQKYIVAGMTAGAVKS